MSSLQSLYVDLARDFDFLLASKSPRRKSLLQDAGFVFNVQSVDTPELVRDNSYEEDVLSSAKEKADAIVAQANSILVACDTVVVYNQRVFGKPQDKAAAKEMLSQLSGKTHTVFSGLVLKVVTENKVKYYSAIEETQVCFRDIGAAELERYLESETAFDKAGAYGIQDIRSLFVKKINGCYYNVIGLPLVKLHELLIKIKREQEDGIS